MLVDARTLAEGLIIDTDVCIVGAGAAGITLAREFIGRSFRVWLLESGDFEFDRHTQDLYRGENLGFSYMGTTRMHANPHEGVGDKITACMASPICMLPTARSFLQEPMLTLR